MVAGMSAPPPLYSQTQPADTNPTTTAPTGKTMQDYVNERGFYSPTGSWIADKISQNRANFDMVRDYAFKYAPLAGADPVIVVWWAFVETGAPVSPYTWNNCHNQTDYAPDYLCPDDDWQVAYGQQFNVAYNQLVHAFEAVYGSPNDKQKVQQVIQEVITKANLSLTAPSNLTVADIQNNSHSGQSNRKWALLLSRDPGISVYLLSTALVNFNRQEAFGWGNYYRNEWQNYSNALNDVITAWGAPGTPGGTGAGSGSGPTEPPIKLEVPDCPGVTREINAYNLPPSIYPKPNCGGGTPGNGGIGSPTGEYGTGDGAPPANSVFWLITNGQTFPISQGYGLTDYAQGQTGPGGIYEYCNAYNTPGHCGVDVSTPLNTPAYAPLPGTVICDGTSTSRGGDEWENCSAFDNNTVGGSHKGRFEMKLDNGDYLILGHLTTIDVRIGDKLNPGDKIGTTGQMTVESGPHFHIEYRSVVNGQLTTYDPREMLGQPASGSQPSVKGVSTKNGQVLQATTASNFGQFQQKYGFNTPTSPSQVDFDTYAANIATLRDFAVKWAPKFNLEPEMVVMWSLSETTPPYDSWSYSHCHNMGGVIDPGEVCGDNNWQIGYGQQWSTHDGLDEAFIDIYGADDPAKVQQVLQNSASKAGLSQTAPRLTAASLSTGSDRFWSMVLGRDQEISAYMVAKEIAGDAEYAKSLGYNNLFEHACANWGAGYCPGDGYFQTLSNTMNDVLLHWGIAGSGLTGQVCQAGVPSASSNCSTMPDSLNGLDTDEFIRRINANLPAYKRIAACANVPWEMMAAIHLRETSLQADYHGDGLNGAQGPWQIDPTGPGWGTIDPYDFEGAGCELAKIELQAKAASGPVGRPLTQDMDPTVKDNEYSIKDAFFAYNGRGGFESNIDRGCTPDVDGNPDWDFDCSAYVMNNWDKDHTNMCINGNICQPNDGTWKVYYKLHFSTYDANGALLVYGGRCTAGNEVINGFSAPTKAGNQISSQFFANNHPGIDIAAEPGEGVFAIADGEIVESGWNEAGGYYSILYIPSTSNSPEWWVYYGHLDPEDIIEAGNDHVVPVLAGQHIGTVGKVVVTDPNGNQKPNGTIDQPQLHFDIRLQKNESSSIDDHVHPCTLDILRNSYTSLVCTPTEPTNPSSPL